MTDALRRGWTARYVTPDGDLCQPVPPSEDYFNPAFMQCQFEYGRRLALEDGSSLAGAHRHAFAVRDQAGDATASLRAISSRGVRQNISRLRLIAVLRCRKATLIDIAIQSAYLIDSDDTTRWPEKPSDTWRFPAAASECRSGCGGCHTDERRGVKELLERLSSGRVDSAWREFLARYSPLILHVIRRHDAGDDPVTECFNHVCAALSDNGSAVAQLPAGRTGLLQDLAHGGRFKPLCGLAPPQQGRNRPTPCVLQLPDLDQQVYQCIYVRRMSRAQCLQELMPRFPELTDAAVSEINARLFALLTPQQRWQLSVRTRALQHVNRKATAEDDDLTEAGAGAGARARRLAAELQEQRQLGTLWHDCLRAAPAAQAPL